MPSRWWLAGALVVGLAVRLAFFRGLVSVDDLNYVRHAAELWKGRFDLSAALYLHATRLLVFSPVAGLFALLGPYEVVAVLWPLAASLATIVLVERIGRRLFDAPTARTAACLVAVLPLAVDEATRLLPGAIINLLVALSVLAFLRADTDPPRRRGAWLAASGAIWGTMTFVGELGFLMGAFFPAAILVQRRRPVASYWPVAAGVVAVAATATAIYGLAGGDPLLKVRISRVILQTETVPFRPAYYLLAIARPFAAHGGVFHLAALGAVVAWRRRHRGALVTAAWFVLGWAALEYAPSSLTTYRPLYKYVRYLSLLSIPGVLLAAYAFEQVRGTVRAGRGARTACVAGVMLAALLLAGSLRTLRAVSVSVDPLRAQLARVQARVTETLPGTVYVTHWLWNTRTGWFARFDDPWFPSGYHPYRAFDSTTADPRSRNRYVQTLAPGEPMAPGLLIVDRAYLDASLGRRRDNSLRPGDIPSVLDAPPASWRVVDRLRVGDHEVVLYKIPAGARWPSGEPSAPR